MKVIKDMSCDIEDILEMADKNIRLAVKYREDDPDSSKAYYNKSVEELNSIKPFNIFFSILIVDFSKHSNIRGTNGVVLLSSCLYISYII